MSMQEIGFGINDGAIGAKSTRFKAKEGETYRISFIWWPGLEEGTINLDAKSPRFVVCKRFYIQNVGYFQDKAEYPELGKLAGQPSKYTVGTIIVVWPTDSSGKLDRARFQNGDYQVKSWVFSKDKYNILMQLGQEEYPLGQVDLNVSCIDTQFQKMTMLPTRESLLRKLVEAKKADDIIARARELAVDLPREIAQDLTPDQVKEKLGRGGAPMGGRGGGGNSDHGPRGGGAQVTSPDFDGMLDDILK